MDIVKVVAWMQANWSNILGMIAVIVTGCSLIVKGAEGILSLLLGWFPQLKNADGSLKHIAALLDSLKNSSWLNAGALNPKKMVAFFVLFGSLLLARPARAEINLGSLAVSYGPSIPLIEYAPNNPHPTSVASGAGLMGSVEFTNLSLVLLGKSYNMLALDGFAFGSIASGPSGASYGQLQLAAAVTTLNSLIGIGWGHGVLDSSGAVPSGPGFLVVMLSFNFALAPMSPPVGVEQGAEGLPRGNTLFFGSM